MKQLGSRLVMVCATMACTMLFHGFAAAESDRVAEGRSRFLRGVEYFKDEDFRNAMVEFKRAYELAPNYKVLYNLAQTAQELKDYAVALKSLERYLADGGNDIAADRRTEVTATIRKLKQRVAEVSLTTNANDAEVFVDDVSVGRTPLSGPLVVSAGSRKISVSKGAVNATRTIDVAGGERAEVTLELVPRGSNSEVSPLGTAPGTNRGQPDNRRRADATPDAGHDAGRPPTTTEPRHSSGSGNSTWIGVAVTGVLAVATGVTGGLALAAKHDFDSTLDRFPTTAGDVSDARDKTRRLALATDILGAATILSGGITIWMAVSKHDSKTTDTGRMGITVIPNGLVARGAF